MTETPNEIKCTDRQLAIFGLALKELNQPEKPIIERLKLLQVSHVELAGVAVGKLWKLILEGDYNTKTFKMQVERMWPTQVDSHVDLLKRAVSMTTYVNTQWGLDVIDTDFEIKSFHKFSQEFVETYNKIGKLKVTDDEMHQRFRKECKDFLSKLNKVYRTVNKKPSEDDALMAQFFSETE